MAEHEHSNSFMIGLVLGAAVGMGFAFLYAPRPGKETREMVWERAAKVKETAKDIIEEAEEKAKEIIAEAKEVAAEIKEAAK